VESALLLLEQQKGLSLRQSTIGIVGCGHVGSKVKAVAERLGMQVLVCDPPLQKANSQEPTANSYVSLDEIERRCDVITFHVPLTRKGQYATWHLADDDFFHRLSRVPYIINTSRGEVVDNKALLSAMEERRVRDAIIDVWEDEPHPDSVLLEKVFIGTPHIAGYSADGKVNADNMVIDAICQHFSLPHPGLIAPPKLPADFTYSGSPLDLYNPMEDSKKLKAASSRFEQLRNNYPLRREKMG
jgi:erythronate-4-phosphate dehydrogenase